MLGSEPRRWKGPIYEERLSLERKRFACPRCEISSGELDQIASRRAIPSLEVSWFRVPECGRTEYSNVDPARLPRGRKTEELDIGLAHCRAQRLACVVFRGRRDRSFVRVEGRRREIDPASGSGADCERGELRGHGLERRGRS